MQVKKEILKLNCINVGSRQVGTQIVFYYLCMFVILYALPLSIPTIIILLVSISLSLSLSPSLFLSLSPCLFLFFFCLLHFAQYLPKKQKIKKYSEFFQGPTGLQIKIFTYFLSLFVRKRFLFFPTYLYFFFIFFANFIFTYF